MGDLRIAKNLKFVSGLDLSELPSLHGRSFLLSSLIPIAMLQIVSVV